MLNWWRKIKCTIAHDGGTIGRDASGRINWRCTTCGRWSDHPVSLKTEALSTDQAIVEYIESRGQPK